MLEEFSCGPTAMIKQLLTTKIITITIDLYLRLIHYSTTDTILSLMKQCLTILINIAAEHKLSL